MERYRTIGRGRLLDRISAALIASGAEILRHPEPDLAPFEYRIRTPHGEVLDLICYAFTANKYQQDGRPKDEHRFQIKYGSDFDRYHEIYLDPRGAKVTLMFGVHVGRSVFIAVDPRMHNPTWFSASVEFKEADLEKAERKGWNGWERERSMARRKKAPPFDSRAEILVAFRPDQFLRYVQFERAAGGIEAGERLLLSDRIADRLQGIEAPPSTIEKEMSRHPLEIELGLSASEILDVIGGAFRLQVAVRGSVAEHHLFSQLTALPQLEDVQHLDRDGQPDFEVRFRRRRFRIECKNVRREQGPPGPRVDFQKSRNAKEDPCSRFYLRSHFEILAACLHPVTLKWEFRFCPTAELPDHKTCAGRMAPNVSLTGPAWSPDVIAILDALSAKAGR